MVFKRPIHRRGNGAVWPFQLVILATGLLAFPIYATEQIPCPTWQLAIVTGGLSKHLTHKYEPQSGYNEWHQNIGIEIGQYGPGWTGSAQATYFVDSHRTDSILAVGAYGYRQPLPVDFSIYGGLGLGYTQTSYYDGAIILPYIEISWWRFSIQGSYLPEIPEADSGLAMQLKTRILEW